MDREIVRRAQAGDHDAFEDLARDALEPLYGTARLILLREDMARDATRETLTAAWRDIRGLRDPLELDTWVYRILIRSCQRLGTKAAPAPDGERGDSEQAFARLTQDQRSILALVHHASMRMPEVAAVLGVPMAAAEARRDEAFDALLVALELDDTEAARTDLGWRIRPWMDQVAAAPDLTGLMDEVADATRAAPRRPRLLAARGGMRVSNERRRLPGRRSWLGLVAGLAVVVAATGGLWIAQSIRPPAVGADAPPGAFRPSGEITALVGTLFRPTITVLADGRVLVIGIGDQLLGAILYDPVTETYGDPIRDNVLRRGSTATLLRNNLVLLAGGTFGGSESPAQTTVLFDPFSETFAPTNPLSVARTDHQATLLDDGRVLVTGGLHPFGGSSSASEQPVSGDTAEIYDPATGSFGPTGSMLRPRAGHTATKLADGRVLIVGGYTADVNGNTAFPAAAEIFDPATGQFGAAGTLGVPRTKHSATLLADGRVLIIGGSDEADPYGNVNHALRQAEMFDPKTLAFTRVASLVTERSRHSATLLTDGRVLVAGGSNEFGSPLSTEIFDPVAGTFRLGPRAGATHDATVAPVVGGGRVLLVGSGEGGSEVFDPAAGTVAVAASASPGTGPFSPVDTSSSYDRPALVTLDDGRIVVLGDEAAEIFDPVTGRTNPARRTDPATHWPARHPTPRRCDLHHRMGSRGRDQGADLRPEDRDIQGGQRTDTCDPSRTPTPVRLEPRRRRCRPVRWWSRHPVVRPLDRCHRSARDDLLLPDGGDRDRCRACRRVLHR
ncbi:MAG TPA: kelch repeat-containing protein [Candidatus Limnocylindrales bacterium]